MERCLTALGPFERVVVLDSQSTDRTTEIAARFGAEVVQFTHNGGYPKKRQWALDNLEFKTQWVLLLDADEVVTPELHAEIERAIGNPDGNVAFFSRKGFHALKSSFLLPTTVWIWRFMSESWSMARLGALIVR